MDLRKFPLDTQTCHLEIGSFAYTARDVVYRWQDQPYEIDPSVQLAQFSLEESNSETKLGISTRRDRGGFRNDSSVQLNFVFKRQTGFFLLQIYTPLTLIVFCSWVSFWLVKTEKGGEVPARTALGATTVLSIVNLGFGGKAKPKVGYATAMDIYIIICFFAVFAALVEFACINFIDTFIKRFKAWEEEEKKRLEKEEEEEKKWLPAPTPDEGEQKEEEEDLKEIVREKTEELFDELVVVHPANGRESVHFNFKADASDLFFIDHRVVTPKSETLTTVSTMDACVSTEDEDFNDIEDDEEEGDDDKEEDKEMSSWRDRCLHLDFVARIAQKLFTLLTERFFRKYSPRIGQMKIYRETLMVILAIDSAARKLFPLVFVGMQAVYWTMYLYWL